MTPKRKHKLWLVKWHRSLRNPEWPTEARKSWNDHTREVSTEMNNRRFPVEDYGQSERLSQGQII